MNFHDILMLRGFVGGGGATTWSDLGESPTGGDTLTWDGNTEGVTIQQTFDGVESSAISYHISNVVVNAADTANGATVTGTYNGESFTVSLTAEDFSYNDDGYAMISFNVANGVYRHIEIVPYDNYVVDEFDGLMVYTYPAKGIWVPGDSDFSISLTIPGYTGFPSVNKVPEKYLPENYIKELITEELGVIENGTY